MFPASGLYRAVAAADCGLPENRIRLGGTLDRAVLGSIRDRLRRAGVGPYRLLTCDVTDLVVDLRTLDGLARLQLTVRRLGVELRYEGAPERLTELAALVGLDDVLPFRRGSGVEPRRQPEEREQPLGVEEEHDAADLAVRHVEDLQ